MLDRHLTRLRLSAEYFGFVCDLDNIRHKMSQYKQQIYDIIKIKLLLSADGRLDISAETLSENSAVLRIAVSDVAVDSSDVLRYHKTTRRDLFDKARAERPECDELLFLNERGELTEGSYHNLVVKLDGRMLTPPLGSGLLPGVLREELLLRGEISERVLLPTDLILADELWLINSVRGWRRCVMVTNRDRSCQN
ncbi:MAG: aminotransferase class IV [Deltaproteobacteria bacterium]|nr:aminotransferase class IV [Deltaproteobacteria bacterium]